MFFVVKEGSSEYKGKQRDGSLKNLWLNGSLWNQKWFFYASLEEPFEAPLFLKQSYDAISSFPSLWSVTICSCINKISADYILLRALCKTGGGGGDLDERMD